MCTILRQNTERTEIMAKMGKKNKDSKSAQEQKLKQQLAAFDKKQKKEKK